MTPLQNWQLYGYVAADNRRVRYNAALIVYSIIAGLMLLSLALAVQIGNQRRAQVKSASHWQAPGWQAEPVKSVQIGKLGTNGKIRRK